MSAEAFIDANVFIYHLDTMDIRRRAVDERRLAPTLSST
jgi:predicted nucleic acid-binding protein